MRGYLIPILLLLAPLGLAAPHAGEKENEQPRQNVSLVSDNVKPETAKEQSKPSRYHHHHYKPIPIPIPVPVKPKPHYPPPHHPPPHHPPPYPPPAAPEEEEEQPTFFSGPSLPFPFPFMFFPQFGNRFPLLQRTQETEGSKQKRSIEEYLTGGGDEEDDDDDESDDDEDDDSDEDDLLSLELDFDVKDEARRAPLLPNRIKKRPKQKKQKKPKKQKKVKKQKKQPYSSPPLFPAPIVIYQNEGEILRNNGTNPPTSEGPGGQGSVTGYYMIYVVDVRWSGNNYTQTVMTGRPYPTITVPATNGQITDPNSIGGEAGGQEGFGGYRPPPACVFSPRSTTTEHFGGQPEGESVVQDTESPQVEEVISENTEHIGEQVDESDDDSSDEDYDIIDPKKKKAKNKKKNVSGVSSPAKPPSVKTS